MPESLTYLALILLCFAFPFVFLLSHKKIRDKAKISVFPSFFIISAVPFILWDILAIKQGHWYFNHELITGITIFSLPIEEYLFLILIPYACFLLWLLIKRCNSWQDVITMLTYHWRK